MGRTTNHGGRTGARLAVLAFVLGIGAAGVGFVTGPVHAAAPTIRIDSPTNTEPLTDPVIHVAGEAFMPSGGTVTGQVRIEVTSLEGFGGNFTTVNANNANRVPFTWEHPTTRNGMYRVLVTASGNDGAIDPRPGETRLEQRDVAVEVDPAPPTGLTAKANKAREVGLAWNPNPEPDLVGYQVQRLLEPDDEWVAVVNTTDTVYTDTATTTDGGTYHYRIVAVRRAAAPDQILYSAPSAEKEVDVPNPPPTTTTSTTSTTVRSGTGGGTGGGSTSTTTTVRSGTGGGSSTPQLARSGKADLSSFASVLQSAQRPAPRSSRPKAGEDDGGYEDALPYKQGEESVGEDGTALGVGIRELGGDDSGRNPIAFVAASLLVTVILMHLLWLKREVDRAPDPAVIPAELSAEAT